MNNKRPQKKPKKHRKPRKIPLLKPKVRIKNSVKPDLRTNKRKTGDIGEDIACRFLMKQGYSICERNYLRKYGEIDIVAIKGYMYHFIEVKTVTDKGNVIRETPNYQKDTYKPEDNVHTWKLQRLSRVIQAYILEKQVFEYNWAFHVVVVKLNMKTRRAAVSMIKDIVL